MNYKQDKDMYQSSQCIKTILKTLTICGTPLTTLKTCSTFKLITTVVLLSIISTFTLSMKANVKLLGQKIKSFKQYFVQEIQKKQIEFLGNYGENAHFKAKSCTDNTKRKCGLSGQL